MIESTIDRILYIYRKKSQFTPCQPVMIEKKRGGGGKGSPFSFLLLHTKIDLFDDFPTLNSKFESRLDSHCSQEMSFAMCH